MPRTPPQRLFDRAVAHFNARRFFRAHEDWEDLWHEADGDEKRWLQGLIQIAAAFFHVERGFHATGFVKLVREGWAKAWPFPSAAYGIAADAFEASLAPWRAHAERVAAGTPLDVDAPDRFPSLRYEEGVAPEPLPGDDPG